MRFGPTQMALTLLSTFAFMQSVQADCEKEYRLDQSGRVMATMPILDQHDVGTCYAQTAAQLLTAKLRTDDPVHNAQVFISPISTAITTHSSAEFYNGPASETADISRGDVTYRVLGSLAGGSVCQFKDVDEKIFSYRAGAGVLFDQIQSTLAEVFDHKDESVETAAQTLCQSSNPLQRNFEEIAEAISSAIKQQNPSAIVRSLVEGDCKRAPLPKYEILGKHFALEQSGAELRNFIDDYFNGSPKIPVAIDYCSTMLTVGGTQTRNESKLFHSEHDFENQCRQHASLVIGRRPAFDHNGKKACEYLIRNSWGLSCKPYAAEMRAKCKDGQIWVTGDQLEKNLIHANSIR